MEQRPPRVPELAWVEEEEEGPGAAPAQQTEEVVPFQSPQEVKEEEETIATGVGLRPYSPIFLSKTSAALLSLLVEEDFYTPKQLAEALLPLFDSLAEDRRRAAEQLRQALRYLQSPQEPLREAAVRFMGMAGRHLRGQQQELQLICTALEEMACDSSPAIRDAAVEFSLVLRALQRAPYSPWRKLRDRFRSAWRKRPRLCSTAVLFCWSSAER
ncbi:uncharacterized protein LOC132082869 [Ammospiza nelsoni]|uniref:uncharacterized protein LOC132082869 n=1 Tax=Ammospiza nelsoni TaxID=2857394 RepID=UPI00286D4792|nr:uncharacterized protein LOC132082869 [Ammospiza nelsoni]